MRYIYTITCKIDNKIYVGQTKNIDLRWRVHRNSVKLTPKNKTQNHPLYNAIRCHGLDNFVFSVIEECQDSVVDERECYWIDFHNSTSREKGYNLFKGMLVCHRHTDETKMKISNAMKYRVFSEEHKKKLSMQKGWKHTKESKDKISKSKIGKIPKGLPELQARRWSGSGNPRAVLTSEKVKGIREYHLSNPDFSYSKISRYFKISYKVIYCLLLGLTYKTEF